VKGLKNEILTRQESQPDIFHFLPTAHFLKQLPTHDGIFAFAQTQEANRSENQKCHFFQTHTYKFVICIISEK